MKLDRGIFVIMDERPWEAMLNHGVRDYPNEACGVLLAVPESPNRINRTYPAKNRVHGNQRRRFLLDPLDFLGADQVAEREGLMIRGFYHSHPDHPPIPSAYDLRAAWPDYLYLILALKGGRPAEAKAWVLDPEEQGFRQVKIHRALSEFER